MIDDAWRRRLQRHAGEINAISLVDPGARVFHDVMSNAFIWRDEVPTMDDVSLIWLLRPVWHFRTSLIIESPSRKHAPYWDEAMACCPDWVAFLPERRQPRDSFKRWYRMKKAALARWMESDEPELGS